MKSVSSKAVIALVAVGALLVWGVSTYNRLVPLDEAVSQSYAQVQNVMQRQADLIPNLVATVKGESNFERSTLTQVTEARSQLGAVGRMNPADLAKDPELQKKLIEAQASMGHALATLNAAREAYPTLKSNEAFQHLMTELEGSQNRIAVERRRNQEQVMGYNRAVRVMPAALVARAAGFAPHPYFQASDAAQSAPAVGF